jgi:hypothetical protein
MALKVGGQILHPMDDKGNPIDVAMVSAIEEQRRQVEEQRVVAPQRAPEAPKINYVKATPRQADDPDGHYVVSGSTTKKISKKSQYLLDMLTSE